METLFEGLGIAAALLGFGGAVALVVWAVGRR